MIKQNNVCLYISDFIFSLVLFFKIDLHTFIPLTAKANMQIIDIAFCNNKPEEQNNIALYPPSTDEINEIVYP